MRIFPKVKGMPENGRPVAGSTDVADWKLTEFRIDRTLLWQDGTHDIEVPIDAHDRIISCTDLGSLDLFLDRAITASTVDELFD